MVATSDRDKVILPILQGVTIQFSEVNPLVCWFRESFFRDYRGANHVTLVVAGYG